MSSSHLPFPPRVNRPQGSRSVGGGRYGETSHTESHRRVRVVRPGEPPPDPSPGTLSGLRPWTYVLFPVRVSEDLRRTDLKSLNPVPTFGTLFVCVEETLNPYPQHRVQFRLLECFTPARSRRRHPRGLGGPVLGVLTKTFWERCGRAG